MVIKCFVCLDINPDDTQAKSFCFLYSGRVDERSTCTTPPDLRRKVTGHACYLYIVEHTAVLLPYLQLTTLNAICS